MVIDVDEIAKFDEIAPSWWNTDSEVSPLHDINPMRVRFVADRVPLRGKENIRCGLRWRVSYLSALG